MGLLWEGLNHKLLGFCQACLYSEGRGLSPPCDGAEVSGGGRARPWVWTLPGRASVQPL